MLVQGGDSVFFLLPPSLGFLAKWATGSFEKTLTGLPRVAQFVRPSPLSKKGNVLGQHPREEYRGFGTSARTTLTQDRGQNVDGDPGELRKVAKREGRGRTHDRAGPSTGKCRAYTIQLSATVPVSTRLAERQAKIGMTRSAKPHHG